MRLATEETHTLERTPPQRPCFWSFSALATSRFARRTPSIAVCLKTALTWTCGRVLTVVTTIAHHKCSSRKALMIVSLESI